MNCAYPLCRQLATHIPVIEIPTIRTVGLIPPALCHLVRDSTVMATMQLDMAMTICLYEAQVAEYKATVNNMAITDEPTILMGQGICVAHAQTYKFLDWFGVEDWDHLCEGAREHHVLLDIKDVKVKWRPMGWEPGDRFMEMER